MTANFYRWLRPRRFRSGRTLPRWSRQSGLLLASGAGGTTFAIATPPTPSASSRIPLRPTFTQKATGKCRYRPFVSTVAADYLFCANGWDQPWYFNGSTYADMGSVEPTTGSVADAVGGTTFALGLVLDYYIVWRNSALGKETAPHSITHTMVANKDAVITWTDPAIAEFDKARLYRKLQATGTYVKVADIAIATATYTDSSADAAILLNQVYVRRYRTTKPPIFVGVTAHANRLFGWTGKDALLHYGQVYRSDGEFTMDDFPSAGSTSDGGVLLVAPNDGYGPIVSVVSFFEALYVFKRRACYRVTGRTAVTFGVELVFSDRGSIAHRASRVVEDWLYFLDRRGIYRMSPDGALDQAAALEGTKASPLSRVWARLNVDAAHYFNAEVDERGGYYLLAVALDDDPVPLHIVPFDFRRDRYVSLDTNVNGMALGRLTDATGLLHLIRLDDLGDVLEDDIGNADIAVSGTLTGTMTTGSTGTIADTGAAFETADGGLAGAPAERYSSAGAVLDQNRVASNVGTALTLLYYSPSAYTNGSDQYGIGPIPGVFRSGDLDFRDPRRKKFLDSMVVFYTRNSTTTIKAEGAVDAASDVLLKEFALSSAREKQLVPVRQRGFSWAFQLSNRNAGEDWQIAGVDVELSAGNDRD